MSALTKSRLFTASLFLIALSGCSAISSLESASKPVNTFELRPLPAGSVATSRGRLVLEVALPTATGALSSEQIVIKPTPLQIESLPDARWVNEPTEHFQLLLVRSLANSGKYALVSGAGSGPSPDLILMTDLQAFQAEVSGENVTVVVRTTMTIIRNSDGRIMSSRRFNTTKFAQDTTAEMVVSAFDNAVSKQLAEAVTWLTGVSGV